MWPDAVGTIDRPLGIQKVCLGFRWIHRNVDKIYFFKYKNSDFFFKNMICAIHYFIMKVINKIVVIPQSSFNKLEK